jgi:predicted RNA-binding protein YlqC (UPF0109 family)
MAMPIESASDPRDVSAHQLLYRIVCALVDHCDEVSITAEPGIDGATFLIGAHAEDVGKIIGSQGRTAQSVRTVISGMGRKLGRRFTVVVREGDGRPARVEMSARENVSA